MPTERPADDLAYKHNDLERRVSALETARRLESASIGGGGLNVDGGSVDILGGGGLNISGGGQAVLGAGSSLVVTDGAGATRVTVGKQTDGSYGVTARDPSTGQVLSLAQLAFGPAGATDPSGFVQSTVGSWQAGSLSLPVNVVTGRLLVMVSAQLASGNAVGDQANMSWRVAGPTTVLEDLNRVLAVTCFTAGNSGILSATFAYVHTGLTAGAYTITDRYYAGGHACLYQNRSLIAFPF